MLLYVICKVISRLKSDVLVKACPSTPAIRLELPLSTLAAAALWSATRLIVKFPDPVGIVMTWLTVWFVLVGVESRFASKRLVMVAPPELSAVFAAAKAVLASSTLMDAIAATADVVLEILSPM